MNRKGFTLVELVATIALLAVIAIFSFVSTNLDIFVSPFLTKMLFALFQFVIAFYR